MLLANCHGVNNQRVFVIDPRARGLVGNRTMPQDDNGAQAHGKYVFARGSRIEQIVASAAQSGYK